MVDIMALLRSKRSRNVDFAHDVLVEAIRGKLNGGPLFKDAIDVAYSIIKKAALEERSDRLVEAYELVTILRYLSVEKGEAPLSMMQEIVNLLEPEEKGD